MGSPATLAMELTVTVHDQKGSPLADAVVYAPLPEGISMPATASLTHIVEQTGKQFFPFVSAVPINTVIHFPNHDNVKHHVYSFSSAKTFEIKLYKGKNSPPVLMDALGTVTLGCNIHDHMVGYIYVLNTPHLGVSDQNGRVTLRGLQPGTYEIKGWHPGLQSEADRILHHIDVKEQTLDPMSISMKIKPDAYWKADRSDDVPDTYDF